MSAKLNVAKYLDARIALALAKAEAALAGIVSLQHHIASTNPGVIGPAGTVAFSTPSFTPRTGRVRVTAYACVSGGTGVATDAVSYELLRDGAQLPLAPTLSTSMVANSATACGILVWEDVVTPNTAHTWGISMTNGNAHTIEIPVSGGTGGGLAGVLVEELP
jgi:hypothetical protein